MRRYMVFTLAGLASVLACREAGNVLAPRPEGIVVVRDEASFRKKLSQAADVQRILRRSIDPPSLGPGGHACGFEPSQVNL